MSTASLAEEEQGQILVERKIEERPLSHPWGMFGAYNSDTVDGWFRKIPRPTTLGMYKNPINNGIFTISTGCCPSGNDHMISPTVNGTFESMMFLFGRF